MARELSGFIWAIMREAGWFDLARRFGAVSGGISGNGVLADAKALGRASQNRPARCGQTRATVAGWRVSVNLRTRLSNQLKPPNPRE
jgi:hypothetical protein